MRNKLKCMLLLLPTLAIASSLSGTPPYTAISNIIYKYSVSGVSPSGIIVTDSVGNIFFSDQSGHNFTAAIPSGSPVGADFITPEGGIDPITGNLLTGATLWYKNTSNLPVQISTSFSVANGLQITAAPNTNAPSNVSGTLRQVVTVPELNTSSSADNYGGVVLASVRGIPSLNYYQLGGQN